MATVRVYVAIVRNEQLDGNFASVDDVDFNSDMDAFTKRLKVWSPDLADVHERYMTIYGPWSSRPTESQRKEALSNFDASCDPAATLSSLISADMQHAYFLVRITTPISSTTALAVAGNVVSVPNPLLQFYRNLHAAELIDDDVLRLPDNIHWFADDSIGRYMYIRPCYPKLYDELKQNTKVALLGTPGVGKSTAALYFIWRLLHESDPAFKPHAVVYRPQQSLDLFIAFIGNTVSTVNAANIGRFPDSTVFIYDGVTPPYMHSPWRTWLVSSPRADVWSKWDSQTAATRRYVPTFTLTELLRCRAVAYPGVSDEQVIMLYELWGGSARLVLRRAQQHDQRALLSDLRSGVTQDDLQKGLKAVAAADGGNEKYGKSPHLLFHLVVAPASSGFPPYSQCRTVFASEFCRDLVIAELVRRGKNEVRDFLAAAEGSPALSTLRGHLFERLALSALFSQERTWPWQCLSNHNSTPAPTAPTGVRPSYIFSNVNELLQHWEIEPTAVGRPLYSNWPTWDAVTRDATMVTFWQTTVSTPAAHGIKATGFTRANPLMPPGYTAQFVFVVLQSGNRAIPPTAIPQRPVKISGDVPVWAAPDRMQQYLLRLELDDNILLRTQQDVIAATTEEDELIGDVIDGTTQRVIKRRRLYELASNDGSDEEGT